MFTFTFDIQPLINMSCQQSRLVDDAKRVQSLAAKISEIGTTLQGLLKNEAEDSIERRRVIDFLNSATLAGTSSSEKQHIEATLTRLLASTNDEVEQLDQQCKMLLSNVKGMREKIRKKTIDLERNVARLESLGSVRPAFMDEYEQLEEELQVEYERYMVRFRNVDYLKRELRSFSNAAKEEKEEKERAAKRMQKKHRVEELRILEGCDDTITGYHSVKKNSRTEDSKP
jgi:clusterin-associated protein 1